MNPHGTLQFATALPAPSASPYGLTYGHAQLRASPEIREPGARARSNAKRDVILPPQADYTHRTRTLPQSARVSDSAPLPPVAAKSVQPRLAVTTKDRPDTVQIALVERSSVKSDAARYEQRQNQNRELQHYRGGGVIVIGATSLVVVLLVIVLIVILL